MYAFSAFVCTDADVGFVLVYDRPFVFGIVLVTLGFLCKVESFNFVINSARTRLELDLNLMYSSIICILNAQYWVYFFNKNLGINHNFLSDFQKLVSSNQNIT